MISFINSQNDKILEKENNEIISGGGKKVGVWHEGQVCVVTQLIWTGMVMCS
jgi:hypothetical protein